ncbi:MAG: sensor domain-containing diguanylate cyclase [Alphaproteobacteria bacterium]|nr:sensor domain-containing diguanylate cyclase [Alphaproteobacteria bacterium]
MATRLNIEALSGGPVDAQTLVEAFPGPAAWLARGGVPRAVNAAARAMVAALAERPGLAAIAAVAAPRSETVTLPVAPGATTQQTIELALVPHDGGVLLFGHDASLAANLRVALVDSRRRYKDLVEASSDFAWETDAVGRFDFVSPRGGLGFSAAELIGRAADSLQMDADGGADPAATSPFAARQRVESVELWLKRADGEAACVLVSAVPVHDEAGVWRGARGVWHDVTDDRARYAALADAQNRERMLAHIVRTIRDEVEPAAILATTTSTAVRALGADGAQIWRLAGESGLVPAAHHGARPPGGIEEAARAAFESAGGAPVAIDDGAARMIAASADYRRARNGAMVVWRAADGPAWSESDRLLIAGIAGQLGIALAQIAQHEQLAALARTDGLTGLVNARTFRRILARRLAAAPRPGRGSALVYVDLDNFKAVNDRHGHERGDQVLQTVARRLGEAVRAADVVARLGGDEFALWLEDVDRADAERIARRIVAIRDELAPLSGAAERPLGLSVGCVVLDPAASPSEQDIVARADAAMYRIKHAGKSDYAIEPMTPAERPEAKCECEGDGR